MFSTSIKLNTFHNSVWQKRNLGGQGLNKSVAILLNIYLTSECFNKDMYYKLSIP